VTILLESGHRYSRDISEYGLIPILPLRHTAVLTLLIKAVAIAMRVKVTAIVMMMRVKVIVTAVMAKGGGVIPITVMQVTLPGKGGGSLKHGAESTQHAPCKVTMTTHTPRTTRPMPVASACPKRHRA
jgi:hypothetical protein